MNKIYALLTFTFSVFISHSQIGDPIQTSSANKFRPDFTAQDRAAGDSCGAYFNNYIGLAKTTAVFWEPMRRGNASESGNYNGRAQRFTTSQPIEVSGVEFYGWVENSAMDSIMVITSLHEYEVATDSVGIELTRDTVYVSHTAFDIVLPNISVKSYFDAPITMTTDYIVAIHTPTDDSLRIITNDYTAPDGGGENQSHALYDNPAFPSFTGWYSMWTDFSYDYDYLINPLVKFDLHDEFTILNDSICPGAVGAGCVDYIQVGNFSNQHYTGNSATPNMNIAWLWGDGFQNTQITSACHTYNNPGTYSITLNDILNRWDFSNPECTLSVSKDIFVEDSVFAGFTFSNSGLTAGFINTSTNADSVWWDFGDASAGTDQDTPSHSYAAVGTYDVWLYAYNDCFVDSIMQQVTVDDVGLNEDQNTLKIYPNPVNSNFVISGLQAGSRIELINVLGETVFVQVCNDNSESINVQELPTGSYFVRITSDNDQITKKIVIRH